MKNQSNQTHSDIVLQPGFWKHFNTLAKEIILPVQWKALNDELPMAAPSHCIANFSIAAGDSSDEYYGTVFQDSDIAKWLEAAAYALMEGPNPQLEKQADETIALMQRAQQNDGYLNTFYTVKEPGKRWTNLMECHELYCAGHLMEAAVAYAQATGKMALLDVMLRYAHHIDNTFGTQEGKKRGYPGHPEIELALMRMYDYTGETFLFNLAKYFIDERGQQPDYFALEEELYHSHKYHKAPSMSQAKYNQHHLPVREQQTIEGHSVRALYLVSGMIDVAAQSQDNVLMSAAKRLFSNAVQQKMYVTGAVGSTYHGEAFTLDYDLPNDTAYGETCASIALIFAAVRLFKYEKIGLYGDVIERALYNTCLAGMSLNGRSFFYVNPLEADPLKSMNDPGKAHVRVQRQEWFGCACCPPNLVRLLLSLPQYLYQVDQTDIYVVLYINSELHVQISGKDVSVRQESEYPYDGRIRFILSTGTYGLHLRIPDWATGYTLTYRNKPLSAVVEHGYVHIHRTWQEGDVVVLTLPMDVRRVYARAEVSETVNQCAVQRGPLVYCAEEADNGKQLHRFCLPTQSQGQLAPRNDIAQGMIGIDFDAWYLRETGGNLYCFEQCRDYDPKQLRMIPYYAWANRGAGEMRVWQHECLQSSQKA